MDRPLPPSPPFGAEILEAASNEIPILRDSMSLYTDDKSRPIAGPIGPVYEEIADDNELNGDISIRRDSMSLHDIPAGPVDDSLSEISSIHPPDDTNASIDWSGMNERSADQTLDHDSGFPDLDLSVIENSHDDDSADDSVFGDLLNQGFLEDSDLTDAHTTLGDSEDDSSLSAVAQ